MTSVFIFASAMPKPHKLPESKSKPVNLIELREDYTILDWQIEQLHKHNLTNIYIVVGYKEGQIIDHCHKRKYKIKYISDMGYDKFYSSLRTYRELKNVFLSPNISYPVVVVFHDQLWGPKTLQNLLNCKGEICIKGGNFDGLVKFTKSGMRKFIIWLGEVKAGRHKRPVPLPFAIFDRYLSGHTKLGYFDCDWLLDVDDELTLKIAREYFG